MSLNVLCLDDDNGVLVSAKAILKTQPDCYTQIASTWEQARLILEADPIDILLLDVNLGEGKPTGLDLLPQIKKKYPSMDVVIVTGEREPKLFEKAMNLGAADYYPKPVQLELALVVRKLAEKRDKQLRCNALVKELSSTSSQKELIGRTPAFLNSIETAKKLKGRDASVLIEAETGTGKELLAKFVHDLEGDPYRPFIVVNCATLNENLVESELFGHEKGSFTGALDKSIGKFQLAHGGDIFLDEINSLNPSLQGKLLRVLQEKKVHPVGGKFPIEINFRVIAATNENLKKLVESGRFREDLYHRLNVVRLTIPPLRKRREDIPLLVEYFLRKFEKGFKRKTINSRAMSSLMDYDWPGNIRELENQIHSLVILSSRDTIDIVDLQQHIINQRIRSFVEKSANKSKLNVDQPSEVFDLGIKDFKKMMRLQYIRTAIQRHNGNIKQTAETLGISRRAIYDVLQEGKQND